MKITLVSSSVAYDLGALIRAQQPNFPLAPHELIIWMPDATSEAANAGTNIKIGRPNSITAPTDVTGPEVTLQESGTIRYAPSPANIEMNTKWAKGSANNVVLYISGA